MKATYYPVQLLHVYDTQQQLPLLIVVVDSEGKFRTHIAKMCVVLP
jgi:hypothetical protein